MESAKTKGRRSSGALGLVLEQVKNEGFSREKSGGQLSRESLPSPAGDRFYPTKGFAKVPAAVCRPWSLADRPDAEFEHQDDLERSLKSDGQLQPAVVRPLSDPAHPELRYEVIAGQVRWRAAMKAGLDLDIVIRELTDEAAFRAMVAENEFRRGLSDYARALRLQRALDANLYRDKSSMATACGLSNSQLSYLLGFARLDPAIVARFSDITAISARLGYVLQTAADEGFRSQIMRDIPRIEKGEIKRDEIPGVWRDSVVPDEEVVEVRAPRQDKSVSYRSQDGAVVFTVKRTMQGSSTIHFAKPVAARLDSDFLRDLSSWIDERLQQTAATAAKE